MVHNEPVITVLSNTPSSSQSPIYDDSFNEPINMLETNFSNIALNDTIKNGTDVSNFVLLLIIVKAKNNAKKLYCKKIIYLKPTLSNKVSASNDISFVPSNSNEPSKTESTLYSPSPPNLLLDAEIINSTQAPSIKLINHPTKQMSNLFPSSTSQYPILSKPHDNIFDDFTTKVPSKLNNKNNF